MLRCPTWIINNNKYLSRRRSISVQQIAKILSSFQLKFFFCISTFGLIIICRYNTPTLIKVYLCVLLSNINVMVVRELVTLWMCKLFTKKDGIHILTNVSKSHFASFLVVKFCDIYYILMWFSLKIACEIRTYAMIY